MGRSFGSPSEEKENKDVEDGEQRVSGGSAGGEKGSSAGGGKPQENWTAKMD